MALADKIMALFIGVIILYGVPIFAALVGLYIVVRIIRFGWNGKLLQLPWTRGNVVSFHRRKEK